MMNIEKIIEAMVNVDGSNEWVDIHNSMCCLHITHAITDEEWKAFEEAENKAFPPEDPNEYLEGMAPCDVSGMCVGSSCPYYGKCI